MLKELVAVNYRSLRDLALELGPFNVLIGPNASGKTNIMDCFAFLAGLARGEAPGTLLARRGGFDRVRFGGNAEVVRLEATIQMEGRTFTYAVELRANGWSEILKAPSGGHEASHKDLWSSSDCLRREPELASYMASWAFYSFSTRAIRQTLPVRRSLTLAPDGSNLAQVLMTLVHELPKVYARIEETLRQAMPEVEELLTPLTEDGRTYIAIREEGFAEPFDYHQLSDGTLKLLAYITAVSLPGPKLICFEEPENFIHPHLMEFLVDVLKKSGKQIVIATHSPLLVDYVEPEDVIVVEKEPGRGTVARRIEDPGALREKLNELGVGLGDYWRSGALGGVSTRPVGLAS